MLSLILTCALLAAEPKSVDLAEYVVEIRGIVEKAKQEKKPQAQVAKLHKELVKLNAKYKKSGAVMVLNLPVIGESGEQVLMCRLPEEAAGIDGITSQSGTFLYPPPRIKQEEKQHSKMRIAGLPYCDDSPRGAILKLADGDAILYIHLANQQQQFIRLTK